MLRTLRNEISKPVRTLSLRVEDTDSTTLIIALSGSVTLHTSIKNSSARTSAVHDLQTNNTEDASRGEQNDNIFAMSSFGSVSIVDANKIIEKFIGESHFISCSQLNVRS